MAGRKSVGDRVKINIQVAPEIKERLISIGGGPRRIGKAIHDVMKERDRLMIEVEQLRRQNEGLKDRLHGLSPLDLP
jgi:hypothetical protein